MHPKPEQTMAQPKPYQAYQTNSVATSNQKQLVIMLFDGMSRFTTQALTALEERDFEAVHMNLHKTGKILLELLATLNEAKGGEIARNLKNIYLFCYEQVVVANLKKDAQRIREVQQILNNVGDGFRAIGQKQVNPALSPQNIRITG